MSRFMEIWEPILSAFEMKYPHVVDRMVDWHPFSKNEIIIKLNNGEQLVFNYVGNNIRKLELIGDSSDATESQWRNEFSNRLCMKMAALSMPQWELSRLTRISEITLSKYMNGHSTPSAYNLRKLAMALKCSVQELNDFVL